MVRIFFPNASEADSQAIGSRFFPSEATGQERKEERQQRSHFETYAKICKKKKKNGGQEVGSYASVDGRHQKKRGDEPNS